uniref:Uncharacterized protein n=1 Tax=Arundo donax TaxID=35708 RepID=A0A0A9EP38_ARUDO
MQGSGNSFPRKTSTRWRSVKVIQFFLFQNFKLRFSMDHVIHIAQQKWGSSGTIST